MEKQTVGYNVLLENKQIEGRKEERKKERKKEISGMR